MCRYQNEAVGYACPYPGLANSDCCIFHLEDENKDARLFEDELEKLLAGEGADPYQMIARRRGQVFSLLFARGRFDSK